ncbi:hypothetical protein SDC9_157165 [bioreactor metagenome]|uniref:Uncharacterized protein n=1 Tax=bioreactor metagenome TaxID=1076179 RepID=A0A645F8K3_9ZZZZ
MPDRLFPAAVFQQRFGVFEGLVGAFVAGEHPRDLAFAGFAGDFRYFGVFSLSFDDEVLVGHRRDRRLVGDEHGAAAFGKLAQFAAGQKRRFAAEPRLHFVED